MLDPQGHQSIIQNNANLLANPKYHSQLAYKGYIAQPPGSTRFDVEWTCSYWSGLTWWCLRWVLMGLEGRTSPKNRRSRSRLKASHQQGVLEQRFSLCELLQRMRVTFILTTNLLFNLFGRIQPVLKGKKSMNHYLHKFKTSCPCLCFSFLMLKSW